jgi:hypothetical protein
MPKSDNFSYEVLLGDPEGIKADLIEGETMERNDLPVTRAAGRIWA